VKAVKAKIKKALGPHKGPLEHKVHSYLRKHYPEQTTDWVCNSAWEKNDVPLDRIAYGRRPGGRDPNKVASMAKRLASGWKPKRVVLVDPGGSQKMTVADGYHRCLAAEHEGQSTIRSFVGTPRVGAGNWKADIRRMQAEARNATGLENEGG
jgi:hypothetical protein